MITSKAWGLRVEHLEAPVVGLTKTTPRLSWRLPLGAGRQVAYQIRVDDWESGRIDRDQSLLVPYAGPPLRSRQRVDWTVRVWTDAGVTDWADPSAWEMGLVQASDWISEWISPIEKEEIRGRSPRPAYLLRTNFVLSEVPDSARLYATARGIYEPYLNGVRIGTSELAPGWTSYSRHLQVQTYDVTAHLRLGPNTVGVVLSDGWFRGQVGGSRLINRYGDFVSFVGQLHLDLADGSTVIVPTGDDWEWRTSAIHQADLMEGQESDLRDDVLGWSEGWPRYGWAPVSTAALDPAVLCSSPAPPVRRIEEIRPARVTRHSTKAHVADLGRNISGWLKLNKLGPADTELTIEYGEALDGAGDLTMVNLVTDVSGNAAFADSLFDALQHPLQVDRVISSGRPGQIFEPRHTVHGFRYAKITGHSADLTADDVTGVVVHSDLHRTGWFRCSNEKLNRLHDASVWGFRTNACDIPTDNPTRERTGWAGDWQLFFDSAAFVYDVAGFTEKWLRDLRAEQLPDGRVRHSAPDPLPLHLASKLGIPPGSAGWGDAAVLVPWEMYRAYADADILAESWASMAAWVDFGARQAAQYRHPERISRRTRALPHERYLWDCGFHWGEWLEAGSEPAIDETRALIDGLSEQDHGAVATAYLSRSAGVLTEVARILGRAGDEARYTALAAASRLAWQHEFMRPAGRLSPHRQATYVRALSYDLVPHNARADVARNLNAMIERDGMHLGTGFLSTPCLLPVLADAGFSETAYALLMQDSPPSWLSMIGQGATTIWESWTGYDEWGQPSHSHNNYAKGAVIAFLHRYVGGVRLVDGAPAYKRFQVRPVLGGGLTWAEAEHDSPYGRIATRWELVQSAFKLEVEVPPGTTADIWLPSGERYEAGPGRWTYACSTEPA